MKLFKNVKNLETYKFSLICPVLYGSERGQNEYFRKLSSQGIQIPPHSDEVYYLSVSTFKRWLKTFKQEGLNGLKEKTRSDKSQYRKITPHLVKSIEDIKQEMGFVSVSDLYRKLLIYGYITHSDICYETLRKFANQQGLLEDADKVGKQRKKFEKEFINQLWMVDFKEGKRIKRIRKGKGKGKGNRLVRTFLCAIIDDSSRVIVGYEWGLLQDSALFARALKKAIAVYGIPEILYCDQAKVFRSAYIMQICARLEISLVNAPPYSPESKAKIERFNRTIQQMFYPLVIDFQSLSIDDLNQRFSTFIDDIYHVKVHTSLDEPPLKKYHRQLKEVPIRRKTDEQLEQIFLCSMRRKVRRDATVSINNAYYEVDMKYVDEWIEIRFALDNPHRYFLFEQGQLVGQLKQVNMVENANRPHISTSYSKLLKQ